MIIAENFHSLNNSDTFNAVNIIVDGSPNSNLAFSTLDAAIQKAISLKKQISIEVCLDLQSEKFCFHNELEFALRRKSLEVLLEKISQYPEAIFSHIILYRGTIDYTDHIFSNIETKLAYKEWMDVIGVSDIEPDHLQNIFSSHLLSSFLHSLGALIPEHIKPVALFSLPRFLEIGKVAELISEETFPHIEIGIKDPKYFMEAICWGNGSGNNYLSAIPPKKIITDNDVQTAVILPEFGHADYTAFENVCKKLMNENTPYKIIEENLLNEKWYDIDHIIFDKKNTSFDGNRMVDGFIAAGGKSETFDEFLSQSPAHLISK